MNVCLIGDLTSVHFRRWVTSLHEAGIGLHIISFESDPPVAGPEYHFLARHTGGAIDYLTAIPRVKSLVRKLKPGILHAHYATGFGWLGAASGWHPLLISVWGSDVYEFPRRSRMHAKFLSGNLRKADLVLSTSHAMAAETKKYYTGRIEVTPFGVDTGQFAPGEAVNPFHEDAVVIGTVKALEKIYGIDLLILAFSRLKKALPSVNLKLLITGSGSMEHQLKKWVRELDLDGHVLFTGKVKHGDLPALYNAMDIFAALSRSESFGVSALEASACGKPVVVSNTGGLAEVTEEGKSGFIVPVDDPAAAADALAKLVTDKDLRIKMGAYGRERTARLYEWKDAVGKMISIYRSL